MTPPDSLNRQNIDQQVQVVCYFSLSRLRKPPPPINNWRHVKLRDPLKMKSYATATVGIATERDLCTRYASRHLRSDLAFDSCELRFPK